MLRVCRGNAIAGEWLRITMPGKGPQDDMKQLKEEV
jgi:hypothetical protein